MNQAGLAFRLLMRDWQSGAIRILAFSIIIAVTSLSAVGFFTDRIGQALTQQANELLGGDLVVTGSSPIDNSQIDNARERQLAVVKTAEFPSMVVAGDKNQLAAVKAVEAGYPLRGSVRIARELFAPDENATGIPQPGELWAESRLLSALGVKVGDKVHLGAMEFAVTAVITSDPSRVGGNVFSLAAEVIINERDLTATQLITPASRVKYSVLYAGQAQTIEQFRKTLSDSLAPGQRIQGIDDARPEVRSAVDKATRFLGLAALVSVMLACVAVAMSARRYVAAHLDNCAILRCFGATQSTILQLYTWQMLWLGLLASSIGLLLGYLGQSVLVEALGELADVQLPQPSMLSAVVSLAAGMVTLLGFTFPTLLHLRDVPTMRVLRRELGNLPARSIGSYVLGSAIILGLAMIQAKDVTLGLSMVIGALLTFLLLGLAALFFVWLLQKFAQRAPAQWRNAIYHLVRRPRSSVLQIVAFGLGIMALLLLTTVRSDLLHEWQDRLPDDAPNRFLINIQNDQLPAVSAFLTEHLPRQPDIHPMLRARLSEINGVAVSEASFTDDRAKRLVSREFNVSWARELPTENTVVEGEWWTMSGEQVISVEEGLAKTLGVKLGDSLTFDVAGERFAAKVTNLRHVEWDNFRVNFFVIAADGYLNDYPATYITSFYLPKERFQVLNQLLKEFPNVTVIDVAAVLDQVRHIIERVTQTIEYVFVFTLLAGLMVLYAAIHATLDERLVEAAVMRTLGATKKQILQGLVIEFASLGLLAGLIAAIAANGIGWVLATKVFTLDYGLTPSLWLAGMLFGGLVIGVAGVWGTRHVLSKPPLAILSAAS